MRFKVFDVFVGNGSLGSPTAVVYYGGAVDKERMHHITRELGFRDTFFLMPANESTPLFSSLTFTPQQELAICGQGLVAGLFSLLDDGTIGSGRHTVEIAMGKRSVWIEENGGPQAFASIGSPAVSLPPEPLDLSRVLGWEPAGSGRRRLVDVGRSRLVVQVDEDALQDVHPSPRDILKFCSDLDVTGVVLFARDAKDPSLVRSRVFARSLRGAEDPTTGGAAAAILGFVRSFEPEAPPDRLTVHQGDFDTRGGILLVRWDEASGEAAAGGRAVKIAEGNLFL